MTLVRWNPLREMVSLRNAMDRLFDERLARSLGEWPESTNARLPISLDMFERDGNLVIKTNLPGLKAEDIDINVSGNTLTIKGEFKSEEEDERDNVHIMERRFGKFHRAVALPDSVDTDDVEAVFEGGVLELTLPKSEEAKPKRISSKSNS